MKKQLFSILITLFSFSLFSQSIPNGGFENWNTINYENPLGYQTSNLHGNHGSIGSINVAKTTDAFHGSYAIKLTTSISGVDTNFAYFANGDPGKTPPVGGMPYTQMPTGIRLHYKSSIMPGDSSLVLLEFKKNGALIGQYFWAITASQSVYTLFTKTLSPALPMAPDTVVIGIASSFPFGGNRGTPGTMLQVDSISFTGVVSQPANFNGDLESWQSLSNSELVGWNLNGNNVGGNFRTTDAYSGTYAIELQTQNPSFGGGGTQSSMAISGQFTNNGPPKGGLPYNLIKDTLVLFYKYLPADPNDSANINMSFSKNSLFVHGVQKYLHVAGGYQMVQIPFMLPSPADTVLINMSSSSYSTYPIPSSYVGSDLKIDNMYFKSQKIPVANFNLPVSGCIGQPIQLLDNSANMVSGWNWIMSGASPSSSILQNPTITYASAGTKTITLYATNFIGATNTSAAFSRTIAIYPIPSVNVTSTVICGGANANLTATGASSYSWSSGQNTASISVMPTSSSDYTVTGTTNGCSNVAVASVVVPIASIPNICMVTADSLFANNMIYWDKTTSSKIDSFIIYREVSTNVYKRIGAQPYAYNSRFKDTTRSVGPANGDPNITSYRYKLQMRDSCGNYSALSPYHNTVYFTAGALGNYSWNLYNIEGSGTTPVSTFSLFRDNLASGTWTLVGSTAGTQTTLNDAAYASWPNALWRVDALGFNCNPSYKAASPTQQVNKSKSNVKNNLNGVPTSLSNSFTTAFSIAPNPVNTDLTVSFSDDVKTKTTISITDLLGKVIYKTDINNGSRWIISLADINSGIYFLSIEQGNTRAVKKFIKD